MRVDAPIVGHVAIRRFQHVAVEVALEQREHALLVARIRTALEQIAVEAAAGGARHGNAGDRVHDGQDLVRVGEIAVGLAQRVVELNDRVAVQHLRYADQEIRHVLRLIAPLVRLVAEAQHRRQRDGAAADGLIVSLASATPNDNVVLRLLKSRARCALIPVCV